MRPTLLYRGVHTHITSQPTAALKIPMTSFVFVIFVGARFICLRSVEIASSNRPLLEQLHRTAHCMKLPAAYNRRPP